MDRRLKEIIDKYFPYTEDESQFGSESAARRRAKYELRVKVEKVVIEYMELKDKGKEMPPLDLNEIIKRLTQGN